MKQREDFGLGLGVQIDQQVAAGDQIDARKRRIGQHVLDRKHHLPAHGRGHAVSALFGDEMARQSLCRDMGCNIGLIKSFARNGDGIGIDVGRENLQLDVAPGPGDRIVADHGH